MPTESDRAGEQQRDTDGEKNQTEDQQGEHGRSEQVDVDPGAHVHADPCGCVGVHHTTVHVPSRRSHSTCWVPVPSADATQNCCA